jgi:hypothetical protein
VSTIQTLPKRHALIKLDPHPAILTKTLTVKQFNLDPETLAAVKARYFTGLMVPRQKIELPHRQLNEHTKPVISQLLG